ncbi:RING-type domain-containing protein [Aphelenchoides besseyi]|nr:RING-type domain-containing protein [Aphelenchoides besseyi]KAI6232395.1 RING-type domain-containing protein [Aphelenchoides besseyi]
MTSHRSTINSRKRQELCSPETSMSSQKKSKNELKCAICLSPCDNPTLLDGCSHKFCYECIEKWMLHKPLCPLCKTPIKELKHDLKRRTKDPKWEDEGKICSTRQIIEKEDYRRLKESYWPFTSEYLLIDRMLSQLHLILKDRENWRVYGSTIELIKQLEKFKDEMNHRDRKYVFNHALFRFVIYFTDADRSSLIMSTGGVVLNAEYVRLNRKTLTEQWMPFLAREIRAITGLQTIDIMTLMKYTLDALQDGQQAKMILYNHLTNLGVEHPRTFLKQVQSFGSANQSVELYDASSRYEPRRTLSSAFTDDDNDVHVVFAAGDRDVEFMGSTRGSFPATSVHLPTTSLHYQSPLFRSYIQPGSSSFSNMSVNGTSSVLPRLQRYLNELQSTSYEPHYEMLTNSEHQPNSTQETITLNDQDDSDIQIIENSPPSAFNEDNSSESDSDIQFIDHRIQSKLTRH